MLCFAFFFENLLIPVSKAFTVKDDNGALGMRSSIVSLVISFFFYVLILLLVIIVKIKYNDNENYQLFLVFFFDFNDFFSLIALLIIGLIAIL